MVPLAVARVAGMITSAYMILCTVRVCMSWLPGVELGKAGKLIAAVVDPFLGLFSRISFFRTERFDFSPIAALAVLSVGNNLFATLAVAGKVTLGFVLSLLVGAGWSAAAFVFEFLAFLALVRIVVAIAKLNSLAPVWVIVDAILNPILRAINRVIYRGKPIVYLHGLITGFLVLLLFRTAGGALVRLLSSALLSLPF